MDPPTVLVVKATISQDIMPNHAGLWIQPATLSNVFQRRPTTVRMHQNSKWWNKVIVPDWPLLLQQQGQHKLQQNNPYYWWWLWGGFPFAINWRQCSHHYTINFWQTWVYGPESSPPHKSSFLLPAKSERSALHRWPLRRLRCKNHSTKCVSWGCVWSWLFIGKIREKSASTNKKRETTHIQMGCDHEYIIKIHD